MGRPIAGVRAASADWSADGGSDMTESILVIIEGEPCGKGRPRAFRAGAGVRMFTPQKTRDYEGVIAAEARKAMAGRPPLIGPCMLELTMVFAVPASWSKAKRAAAKAGEIVPTKKPDADNVIKALCDSFNAIVWLDDVQVTDLVARKRFGENPHVEAIITPLALRGST